MGLAGVILSLAEWLKRKKQLRWDFSSGQSLFNSVNFILCQCIFTLKAEIRREVSRAFCLPLHIQGQENKTKQKGVQNETITVQPHRKEKPENGETLSNKQPSWDCSTIWCFCCWVWYFPAHSLFPLHIFPMFFGLLGSHNFKSSILFSSLLFHWQESRKGIITLPAGPTCVLHVCTINDFILMAKITSKLTPGPVGNFI